MRRISILLTLFFIFSATVVAQLGNDWINNDQQYFQFKVLEDGFYRITRSDLEEAGFPVASIAASRIQLFRSGQEIAINVDTNPDNTINYLEFYGLKRDGSSDTPLYLEGTQPHTFYNLFSDSATYFLTYQLGSGVGKRMAFSSESNTTGLTPEPYHLQDTLAIFSNVYSSGRQIDSDITLSDYDDGEGWTGSFFSKNQSRTFEFLLNGYTGQSSVTFETVLFGGNGLDHRVLVNAGPDQSSQISIGEIQFSGWRSTFFTGNILSNTISSENELVVTAFDEGFPNLSDRVSIGYVRLIYESEFTQQDGRNAIYALDDITQRKAWLQIPSSTSSDLRAFNVTDPFNAVRLTTTSFSDRLELVVSDVNFANRILIVAEPNDVGTISEVSIPSYQLDEKDYLIITDPLLRSNDDPIEAYKAYRESEDGGSFNVQIANINDLYNQFFYGDPSPLAISNFIEFANSINSIKHVFIIGKGFRPFFVDGAAGTVSPARLDSSFVNIPTYGNPGTDMMYVLGMNADERIPGISIGRLNATEPAQVSAYLNKVVEMEALPFNDLFRKDFLQLSGGLTQVEINSFSQIITNLGEVIQSDFIGGRPFNTGKQTTENVKFIDISDRVNSGVGYITFFGHSSGSVADIEVGRVSDPSFGFANKGKYPIFLVNGCDAGEIFDTNFTYGEDWIFEPDLGAINFIAHTSSALSSTLRVWSDLYYQVGYADSDFIATTVGDVMIEVSKQYFSIDPREIALTQIRQMQLQGDPAYRIFGADHPDFQIDNNSATVAALDGGEILALQDSFKIELIVKNFGRTTNDSLEVQVNRTFPDGSSRDYFRSFVRPLRQDTLNFFIPILENDPNIGTNILRISLDPEDRIEELDDTNNLVTVETSIFSGNTFNLFPINNAIIAEDQVEFRWQSSSPLEEARNYDLEFDTTPLFDGLNRRFFSVSGEVLLNQNFDFSTFTLDDSTTIYWRTRFSDPQPDESDKWVQSSFTLINNSNNGWGQYSIQQLSEGEISGISFNETSNTWEFQTSSTPIEFFTFGADNTSFSIFDIRAIIAGENLNSPTGRCNDDTFNAIAFDRESGDPEAPILLPLQDVLTGAVCGTRPQRIFQFRDSTLVGNIAPNPLNILFSDLIDNMDDGAAIVMFSIGMVEFSEWEPEVISALNQVGVGTATIASLVDGQPVIFFGRKGATEGSATVITNDGSSNPPTEQSILLQDNVIASFTTGSVQSTRIGPSNSWESFQYDLGEDSNDSFSLSVNGITSEGVANNLFVRTTTETIDLSVVDPIEYPFLELSLSVEDELEETPPQLNFWQVNYDLPADALLVPGNKDLVSIQEGQEITKEVELINVSSATFQDSLSIMATLINQASGSIIESSKRVNPPLIGDSVNFEVSFPSIGMDGLNSLVVEVSANENEIYTSNNRFTLIDAVEVNADETNPVIDVTFDGFHILNGDVVSPNPVISVRMRDDNSLLFKTDTTGFNLSLQLPGEGSQFERINFSDSRLSFVPASEGQDFEVEFQPGLLDDGLHRLRILAEDESGNGIRQVDEPYEISFEVVNESTITHFYPYPNPFSTSCRFVFTLTGTEVPTRIKIQIMTVSGRVVREITQDEIGPIRIGNNITSFAWDGRDHYGDQLANGVYFYKVFIEGDGNDFGQRITAGDRAFKNGFGKLYILR